MKRFLLTLASLAVTVGLPFVLVLFPVRAFMQPWVIPFQYSLPGFPPETYGMSDQERLRLGLIGMDSVIGSRGVQVLAEARFADGQPAFNDREISHMQDVRGVIDWMFPLHTVVALAWLALTGALAIAPRTRRRAGTALVAGVIATVVGVLLLAVLGVAAWDVFFTAFHRIFFQGDTWLFLNTDTLIRLYPEVFWFRISLMIGAISVLLAALLVVAGLALRASGKQAAAAAGQPA